MIRFWIVSDKGKGQNWANQLIVIALDFKKAFDSIDWRRLIEIMIEYKINPYIIDLVAKIYSNETTTVCLGEMEKEMESIWNGFNFELSQIKVRVKI